MVLVLQSLSGGFIWTKLNSFKSKADVKFIKYDEEVAAHTVSTMDLSSVLRANVYVRCFRGTTQFQLQN